jgi:hypothetical protein
VGVAIVVLVVGARKPNFLLMRRIVLLAVTLLGCAHQYETPRATTYEYGQVNRPYSGLPSYLCRPPMTLPPEQCTPRTAERRSEVH